MGEDRIVNEVRAIRKQHAEQFNFDLKAIYADLKRQEEEGKRQVVSFKSKPVSLVAAVSRQGSIEV